MTIVNQWKALEGGVVTATAVPKVNSFNKKLILLLIEKLLKLVNGKMLYFAMENIKVSLRTGLKRSLYQATVRINAILNTY